MKIKEWVLVDSNTGEMIEIGDTTQTFRGTVVRVDGGSPPHKRSSTGKVALSGNGTITSATLYPATINAEWVWVGQGPEQYVSGSVSL